MRFLDKYDSLGVLGRGSMGQVHAARAPDDPTKMVVVKVMRPDVADTPRAESSSTANSNTPLVFVTRTLFACWKQASTRSPARVLSWS